MSNNASLASNWLALATSTLQDSCTLSYVLRVILPVGVAYAINKFLNRHVSGGLVSNDSWDWTKEIVLITGGNSGMGKAIVQMLAEKNIKIVILDVSPPQNSLPPGVFFYEVDVSSPKALHKVAEQIRHHVGDPTVLINNAGISLDNTVLDCTEAQVRRTFEVNTMSHFWIVQEFLPAMVQENHGHVVTMASMANFVVIAGNVGYSCTKASVLAFHEGLGQELKHRYSASKIRTSIVHPCWVRTPMTDNTRASPNFNEAVIEPEEVANAVVKQILGGRSGQIIIPRWQGIVSGIGGFPLWLQEFIRDSKAGLLRKTHPGVHKMNSSASFGS